MLVGFFLREEGLKGEKKPQLRVGNGGTGWTLGTTMEIQIFFVFCHKTAEEMHKEHEPISISSSCCWGWGSEMDRLTPRCAGSKPLTATEERLHLSTLGPLRRP